MKARERKELVRWLAWAFEELALGRVWEDLTPRSQDNYFNIELVRVNT